MIERAIEAGVPFAWVAADTVYGVGEIEMALRRAGVGYVLGVTGAQQVLSWDTLPMVAGSAEEVAKALPAAAWRRPSAGEGTKGPRLHDWAYLELAHLEADGYVGGCGGVWTRGLLIRRHIANGELAYFTTWCPAGTPIETLVAVEAHRWAIEATFETAKTELGLDHNETRSWHGWHRYISLVMLAFAVFAVTRHRANAAADETTPPVSRGLRRSSAGRSRRSVESPRAFQSAVFSPPSSSPGQRGAERTKSSHSAST
jgi:SRSO17 transposase